MSLRSSLRVVRILRVPPTIFAGGAVVGPTNSQQKLSLGGHGSVRVVYHQSPGTAAAVGFPRVRQSADGVTFDVVDPINQDPSQLPEIVYRADVAVRLPYVAIEWSNGGAPTTLTADAWAVPE